MIAIVDYGLGNLAAIANMLDFLGHESMLTRDPAVLRDARRLILPGVGAFDRAMRNLRSLGLEQPLTEAVLQRRVPVLGVCLGMQLLGNGSEEGQERGLGWIDATAVRLAPSAHTNLKVPHLGWSEVRPTRTSLLFDEGQRPRFYFAHSYAVQYTNPAATCDYGGAFCCAISEGNIHGVQFHPEKSHKFGMDVLRRFATGGA